MTRKSNVQAMTLIEILVVVALITILVGLLFPAFFTVQERANRTECLSNTRQIAQATVVQFEELVDRLPPANSWSDFGGMAENLLPYMRNIVEVFDCPSNPGNDFFVSTPNCKMPNHDFYVDYELNGYICETPSTSFKRQSMISDFSKAAYVYDYPYNPANENNPDPRRRPAHVGGVNCGYLDGHSAWFPVEEMGNITQAGDDGTEFFAKGHPFWKLGVW